MHPVYKELLHSKLKSYVILCRCVLHYEKDNEISRQKRTAMFTFNEKLCGGFVAASKDDTKKSYLFHL